MYRLLTTIAALGICLLGLTMFTGMRGSDPTTIRLAKITDSWLESLPNDQRAKAMMPFDSEKRVDWHFIPKPTRKGLPLREMNDAQRTAALRIVRGLLSESGYDKAQTIMSLEAVLLELEGPKSKGKRDPNKYYVTVFGDPTPDASAEDQRWGLSFEGHHLSLNFVCEGEKILDSTPMFFAANPGIVMDDLTGPIKKGTRVLHKEETLAFELLASLDQRQKSRAVIAEDAPKDVRFAGEAQPQVTALEGISYRTLNDAQRRMLKELVETYNGNALAEVADERMKTIHENGWDKIHFAWAGAQKPGIGHYYRIQGKTFLIEFANTQPDAAGNPANHIHCYWRDLTGDFDLPIK